MYNILTQNLVRRVGVSMRFWINILLAVVLAISASLLIWDVARIDLAHSMRATQVTLPADTPEKDLLDLIAQQRMADWAFWMMVLTAVSAAATIVSIAVAGTVAGRQLKEGREANIIQSRAYVHHDGIKYISHRNGDGRIFWRLFVQWINVGDTPAKNVNLSVQFGLLSSLNNPLGTNAQTRAEKGLVIRSQGMLSTGHYDLWPEEIYAFIEGDDPFTIVGHLTYDDVFTGTKMHETTFRNFLTGYSGDIDSYFDAQENPVLIAFREDFEASKST